MDWRLLLRYAEGSRDQVFVFYKNMTTAEFALFLPFMFLGLAAKATELRVRPLARLALFCCAFALSPFVLLAALVRLPILRDARRERMTRRRVDGFWLLRAVLGGLSR
jgi:hypothetical protein